MMSSPTHSADTGFLQEPPQLSNQYDADALLRSHLRRSVDPDVLRAIEPSLRRMGELAAGRLLELVARASPRRAGARAVRSPGAVASTRCA